MLHFTKIYISDPQGQVTEPLIQKLKADGLKLHLDRSNFLSKDALEEFQPDLIIAAGSSRLTAINTVRIDPHLFKVPILTMFDTHATEEDIFNAIKEGADDFFRSTTSYESIKMKFYSLLRRKSSYLSNETLKFEQLRLDLNSHRAFHDESDILLSPVEFDILKELILLSGSTVSRQELKKKSNIYGDNSDISLNVHIHSLRKKIKSLSPCLKTIRSRGYCLERLPSTTSRPQDKIS